MSVDEGRIGKEVTDVLFAASGRTKSISRKSLEEELGPAMIPILAKAVADTTGEDVIVAIRDLLQKHSAMLAFKSAELQKEMQEIESTVRWRYQNYTQAEARAIRAREELEKQLEAYEALKREPNAETKSVGAEPGHFTCLLCGTSMGKMSIETDGDWEWVIPNFCPNCGGKVINAGQRGARR